jgi:hypothetical protein
VPALESMTALEIIGAYVAKRTRFQYAKSLYRAVVIATKEHPSRLGQRAPLACWPLRREQGEPKEVRNRAGQIAYSANKVETDVAFRKLFGSSPIASFCQHELCVEFNSWLACGSDDTKDSTAYISNTYPGLTFVFYPSLIAYPLENIGELALAIYTEIKTGKFQLLNLILFDPSLSGFLKKPGSDLAFARMMSNLVSDSSQLHMQLYHFPPTVQWSPVLLDAMKLARPKRNSGS